MVLFCEKKYFQVLTFVTKNSCIFAVMKIDEAIQHFADYVTTERRLAATTVEYYVGEVQHFAEYLAQQQIFDLEEVSARQVREWQMTLLEAGEAPGTVIKQMASLRAWFKYLRKQGFVSCDVMAKVTLPKRSKRLPIFFRENEVEKIYDNIYPEGYDGEVDKMVLRILYETGMRRSELSSLTLAGVDMVNNAIKVRGKRNKERVIPIQNELQQSIAHYIEKRNEVLVEQGVVTDRLLVNSHGHPLSPGMIYEVVERYMPNLSNAERTSPHIFRHTFATHMLNEGANIDAIKELLGHSSLNATEVYTHVTREHLKESYKHAHPRAIKK